MSSHFTLTLDTTPPIVTIEIPAWVAIGYQVDISIHANEELANIQDIYFLDALGTRHDITLLYENGTFHGTFDFAEFPEGFVTLYANLKDTVFNAVQAIAIISAVSVLNIPAIISCSYSEELPSIDIKEEWPTITCEEV